MLMALTIAVPLVAAVLLIIAAVLEENTLVGTPNSEADDIQSSDGAAPETQPG